MAQLTRRACLCTGIVFAWELASACFGIKKRVVLLFFLEKRERSFIADGFVLVERGWVGFFGSTMRIVLGRVAQF